MRSSAKKPMKKSRIVTDCASFGSSSSNEEDDAMDYTTSSRRSRSRSRSRERKPKGGSPARGDLLTSLIRLQAASGGFNWGQAFEDALKVTSEAEALKLAPTWLGQDQGQAWLAALAVAFLEARMQAEKDLWELVVIKAKKYVGKTFGEEKAEEALQEAKKAVEKVA